jgi:hypothetical protein
MQRRDFLKTMATGLVAGGTLLSEWYCIETSGRKDHFLEDTRDNVAYVKNTFSVA